MPPRSKRSRGPNPGPRHNFNPVELSRAAAMKRFREQHGLSQAELGSRLGVSQASVSAYEAVRAPIPEEVFAQLIETAQDVAQTVEEANARATVDAANSDIPPEVLEALAHGARAMDGEPGAAEAMDDAMRRMRGAMVASLPSEQRASVADVKMAYALLAKILGRFDQDLAALVDAQSGDLALSVVQAAEVSPLLARIVEMLKMGPLSNCIALHVMLIVQYDGIRQQRAQERRAMAAQQAAQPGPEPMPAQAAERIEPSLGAFAAAA